jgi:hypothetical protein
MFVLTNGCEVARQLVNLPTGTARQQNSLVPGVSRGELATSCARM